MDHPNIDMAVTLKGVDEAVEKVSIMAAKIEEARTLAGELASILEHLEVKV